MERLSRERGQILPMDHHHHHQRHLQSHIRYAALPPQTPPPFLDPALYRSHPPLPFPPPPSPPSHYHHHQEPQHHHHRSEDGRIYLPYPPPPPSHTPDHVRFLAEVERADHIVFSPPALPRVSERIVFPNGHPEGSRLHPHPHPHPHRLGNRAYVQEEGEESRVRVFDERRVAFRLLEEEERLREEEERLREEEEVVMRLGFVGRKRARREQDCDLEEEGFNGWDLRRQGFQGGQSSHRRDVVYELNASEIASSGGLRSGFLPERPTMLSSPGSSSRHNLSKVEALEKNMRTNSEVQNSGRSHGSREKRLMSKGKRGIFGSESDVRPSENKPPPLKKPSILSRLQYGKPVWKRIQEPQTVLSSPPPASDPSIVFDGNQLEMNSPVELDVSFKSNALVAKEILVSPASGVSKSSRKVSTEGTPKNKAPKDTPISPTAGTPKSHGKIIITRTPSRKIGEEASVSPSSVILNSCGKTETTSTGLSNKNVVNEIPVLLSNAMQHSVDDVTAVKTSKKKMAETIVVPQTSAVQNSDGKVNTAGSLKKKLTKEILVSPRSVMSNSGGVSTMRTPKKHVVKKNLILSSCVVGDSDGIVTTEENLKKKPAIGALVPVPPRIAMSNSNDKVTTVVMPKKKMVNISPSPSQIMPTVCGIVSTAGSLKKKPVEGMSVTPSTLLSNSDGNVSTVGNPKEEVNEETLVPPSPSMLNFYGKGPNVCSSPKTLDNESLVSPKSATEFDKNSTTLTVKKRIRRKKKKKVVSSSAHCLPSLGPKGESSQAQISTRFHKDLIHSKVHEQVHKGSTSTSCHKDVNNMEEVHKILKHSEEVHYVSVPASPSVDPKHSEDAHVRSVVSASPLDGKATSVKPPKRRRIERKKEIIDLVVPCVPSLGSRQEICGGPQKISSQKDLMHVEEAHEGSTSSFSHNDLIHSEVLHKNRQHPEKNQKETASPPLHSVLKYSEDGRNGLTSTGSHRDVEYWEENRETSLLTGPHKDISHGEIPERALISDTSSQLSLQGINLLALLEKDAAEGPTKATVSMDADVPEYSAAAEKNYVKSGLQDVRCFMCPEHLRRDGHATYGREHNKNSEHLDLSCFESSKKEISPTVLSNDKQVQATVGLDEADSPVEDTIERVRVGEGQLGLGMGAKEPRILFEENFNRDGTVEEETARQSHSHMLQIPVPLPLPLPSEAQDTIDHRLPVRTIGDEGNGLSLPVIAIGRLEQSSQNRVTEANLPEILSSDDKNVHSAEMEWSSSGYLSGCKSCCDGGINDKLNDNSNSKEDSFLDIKSSSLSEPKVHVKLDGTFSFDHSISENILPLPPQETKQSTARCQGVEVLNGKKIPQNHEIPKMYPSQTSHASGSSKKPASSHNARHRTWRRVDIPSVSTSAGPSSLSSGISLYRQSPKKSGRVQSSYIRKGNSLIRKPSTVIPRSSPGQGNINHGTKSGMNTVMGFEGKLDSSDRLSSSIVGFLSTSFERPKTPPLPLSTKLTSPLQSFPHLPLDDPLSEPCGEDLIISSTESHNFGSILGGAENQNILVEKKTELLDARKMIYLKHGSNQLVAAPGPDTGNSLVHASDKTKAPPFSSSDLYYRRKRNQLVRDTSSSDSQLRQELSVPLVCPNTEGQKASKVLSPKCGSKALRKTRLQKAMEKTHKRSKFSLVWTLSGTRSHGKNSNFSKQWKILPYLFPWKRTAYWRRSKNMRLTSDNPSLSLISRKLQISRKRDTVYTVSKGGFSLRKSGVLSIGGSNLKWSKSIGRNSKKASEETTIAVAEAERKKREQKQSSSLGVTLKNGNCLPRRSTPGIQLHQGERIFRIGTARYKMDSSRRTLIRIPDEQASSADSSLSGNDHTSFVPRRLLIGNNEYIRIGNGNQLVRNPKKLVRILANEKVRWSLHTARLRLARKQQYCQFFTRFGKCNKEGGKCPYMHDPSKVAICTKFLKGLCASTDCKLTHKVIPERMPDCSYFLQALCTNTSCSYRHVNVNPTASVCEGFLKGYCADGDECRKKHSYVCPLFEATGKCPEGSSCKLHHPKGRKKSQNRKRLKVHDYSRGRYFFSNLSEVGDNRVYSSNGNVPTDEDIFFQEGQFAEYISLDIDSVDNAEEINDPMDSPTSLLDSDLSDSQSNDLDALIKPLRIMSMDPR